MKRVLSTTTALLAIAQLGVAQDDESWTKQRWRSLLLMGLSFPSHDLGYIAGFTNGYGNELCRTQDGGDTWPPLGQCATHDRAIFLLDVAFPKGDGQHGITTGHGFGGVSSPLQYTEDFGETWQSSRGVLGMNQAQHVSVVQGTNSTFASVGLFGIGTVDPVVGVVVSTNNGQNYENKHDWGWDRSVFPADARYGAFPSAQTWYIAGGRFPTEDPSGLFHFSEALSIDENSVQLRHLHSEKRSKVERNPYDYTAVIQKTTDGGNSFQTVYSSNDEFYFNQIACPTELLCWVVAENLRDYHAAVLHTNDGGRTWQTQMEMHDDPVSLMSVDCISERECWVGGGFLGPITTFRGLVWHTTNGGQDWELEEGEVWKDTYVINADFIDSNHGFATALHWSGVVTEIMTYRRS